MNISYNVYVPESRNRASKSEEAMAIDAFMASKKYNMCFEYDTPEEAKKRAPTVRSYRNKSKHKEDIEIIRDGNRIYVVKRKGNINGSNKDQPVRA